MKVINEAPYLDDEEQFWDYRTSEVTDKILFDTTTTGVSDYNDFFNDPEYLRKKKNLVGEIKMITPNQYFEGCAKIFNSSAEKQKNSIAREEDTIEYLKEVILKYKRKFPIGYLNFADNQQEGRHRMFVAGELVGWDTPQPCLIVNWADEELAKKMLKDKEEQRIRKKLWEVRREVVQYRYRNISELESQIQSELDNHFEEDEVTSFALKDGGYDEELGEYFLICVNGVEVPLEKEELQFVDDESDLDIEIDDDILIDDEDIDLDFDDFIKKYGL